MGGFQAPVGCLHGGGKHERRLVGQPARQQCEQRQRLARVPAQQLMLPQLPRQLVPVSHPAAQGFKTAQAVFMSHSQAAVDPVSDQTRTMWQRLLLCCAVPEPPVVGSADSDVAGAVQPQALDLGGVPRQRRRRHHLHDPPLPACKPEPHECSKLSTAMHSTQHLSTKRQYSAQLHHHKMRKEPLACV